MSFQPCREPGCPTIVVKGLCAAHQRVARREANKRVGRVTGSRWAVIRRAILRAQPICNDGRVCGHKSFSVEVDHIRPLAEGGHPTSRSNLQGICRACHLDKTAQEQREQRRRQNGG